MFSEIQKGSVVYVLDKRGETPKYYTAPVKEVSQPYIPNPQQLPYRSGQFSPLSTQQYVNITVEGNAPWGVPANLSVVTQDGLTVSMSREDLKTAVVAAQQESKAIVDSYEKHKAYITAYEAILRELDPAKAQEAEMQTMREEMAILRSQLSSIPKLEDIKALFEKSQTSKAEKK